MYEIYCQILNKVRNLCADFHIIETFIDYQNVYIDLNLMLKKQKISLFDSNKQRGITLKVEF